MRAFYFFVGGPNGSRTRVLALRGPRPRPLDDGTKGKVIHNVFNFRLQAFFLPLY